MLMLQGLRAEVFKKINVMDYSIMSNAEIRIKMKEMEDEYEALRKKVKDNVERMDKLDDNYNEARSILEKRTKGKI